MIEGPYSEDMVGRKVRFTEISGFDTGTVATIIKVDLQDDILPFQVVDVTGAQGGQRWAHSSSVEWYDEEEVWYANGVRVVKREDEFYLNNLRLKGEKLEELIIVLSYIKMEEDNGTVS